MGYATVQLHHILLLLGKFLSFNLILYSDHLCLFFILSELLPMGKPSIFPFFPFSIPSFLSKVLTLTQYRVFSCDENKATLSTEISEMMCF